MQGQNPGLSSPSAILREAFCLTPDYSTLHDAQQCLQRLNDFNHEVLCIFPFQPIITLELCLDAVRGILGKARYSGVWIAPVGPDPMVVWESVSMNNSLL